MGVTRSLTAEFWKQIDERKGVKALLIAASAGEHDTLEFRCLAESREVQRIVRYDKSEFADRKDFRTIPFLAIFHLVEFSLLCMKWLANVASEYELLL